MSGDPDISPQSGLIAARPCQVEHLYGTIPVKDFRSITAREIIKRRSEPGCPCMSGPRPETKAISSLCKILEASRGQSPLGRP